MKVRFVCGVLSLAAVFAVVHAGENPLEKYAKPGEEHKMLAKSAGTWKAHVKFWMKPGEAPDESDGIMKKKMIMGGRFLEEEFTGKFGDQKFTGGGLVGYDIRKKKYVNVWVDSMSTAIMTSEGTYDPEKKTYTYVGEGVNPTTGKELKTRDVLRIVNDDEQLFEMYWDMGKGNEFKVMEITYKRTEEKKKEKDKK